MNKSTIIIIIYVIGLIFGALVFNMWSTQTSPKALLGIGWTALLLIGLFLTEKNEKN
jgi:glucose uptake protein GlcU